MSIEIVPSKPAFSGLFVTFEGGEGTGKSTQAKLLADHLRQNGHDVIVTREPGGSQGAEIVREMLLSSGAEHLGPEFEALLFSIARRDHTDMIIKPALMKGSIVLCDRYLDSTRAYQGNAGNVGPALVAGLETIAIDDTLPDVTILMDMPAEEGLRRAANRQNGAEKDRFEKETIAVHEKRRNAFLKIAENEPNRFVVLSADRPQSQIHADIVDIVDALRIEKQTLSMVAM